MWSHDIISEISQSDDCLIHSVEFLIMARNNPYIETGPLVLAHYPHVPACCNWLFRMMSKWMKLLVLVIGGTDAIYLTRWGLCTLKFVICIMLLLICCQYVTNNTIASFFFVILSLYILNAPKEEILRFDRMDLKISKFLLLRMAMFTMADVY